MCNELETIISSHLLLHGIGTSSSNALATNISCVLQKYCWNDSAGNYSANSSCNSSSYNNTIETDECFWWSMNNQIKWTSFSQATIFTIGYGDPTPKTTLGRIMTIVYALIGMPIALAMLGVGGQLVIHKLQIIINFFERKFRLKGRGKHQTFKVLIATIFSVFLSLIGGCLISAYGHLGEYDWTVALYYWFQTITTIGYGDITVDRDYFIGWRFILLFPYVLLTIFGLALMSALLNLAATVIANEEWRHYCCCKQTGSSGELHESNHTLNVSLPDMTASIKHPKKSTRRNSLEKHDSSNMTIHAYNDSSSELDKR